MLFKLLWGYNLEKTALWKEVIYTMLDGPGSNKQKAGLYGVSLGKSINRPQEEFQISTEIVVGDGKKPEHGLTNG